MSKPPQNHGQVHVTTRHRNGMLRMVAIGLALVLCYSSRLHSQVTLLPPVEVDDVDTREKPKIFAFADLYQLLLQHNPQLRAADLAIDMARGQAVQAGLYPNPQITFQGEEIGGTGGGIHTLPGFQQTIVTAGKRRLGQAVAARSVEIRGAQLVATRWRIMTSMRQSYFDLLILQQRARTLESLLKSANGLYELAKKRQPLLTSQFDLLTFKTEINRLRLESLAIANQYYATWRALAATIGLPDLPVTTLAGNLFLTLPSFDYERTQANLLLRHPNVLAAQTAVDQAELALVQAKRQVVPNVTIMAGYQRNFTDRVNQASYQISVPIPIFNRNQGNIFSAQARVAQAVELERSVRNNLLRSLAAAYGQYALAVQRAEYHRTVIVPTAEKAHAEASKLFGGGQLDLQFVLVAQRALGSARLDYLNQLGAAWKAASDLMGLLGDETWPITRSVVAPRK